MNNKKRNNPFRYLPMDVGRVICTPALLGYRHRRLSVAGERYRGKIGGGMIIVSNHINFGDPFVLGTCFWYRRLFFLAAKELMKNPVVEVLLKGMGCIRIDRDISDINAIRRCVEILKDGRCLAMFPQGGIRKSGEVDSIKAGAILIALQAGVPILPTYTRERQHWWQRRTVVIGKPLDCREYCTKRFPSMTDIADLSERLLNEMKECEKTYEHCIGK